MRLVRVESKNLCQTGILQKYPAPIIVHSVSRKAQLSKKQNIFVGIGDQAIQEQEQHQEQVIDQKENNKRSCLRASARLMNTKRRVSRARATTRASLR